jgi:hypothetical protein
MVPRKPFQKYIEQSRKINIKETEKALVSYAFLLDIGPELFYECVQPMIGHGPPSSF